MTDHQALIEATLREADEIRQRELIAELGAKKVTEAVEPLLRWVSPDYPQSGTVITALGQIGDPLAVDTLIKACRHQALAWIAKDALVQIGLPAVDPLIAALDHHHPDVRFWSIRALGELNDHRAIEPLKNRIEQDFDATNRQFARTTLKSLLLDQLEHEDAALREEAIRALRWLNDTRCVEQLQHVADCDADPAIQQIAAETVEYLLTTVHTDPFEEHDLPLRTRDTNLLIDQLRRATDVPLEKLTHPTDFDEEARTIDTLHDLRVHHTDPSIRTLAYDVLYNLTVNYVRCPQVAARRVAIRGLATLHTERACDMLQQLVDFDPDASVRQDAQDALC